MTVVAVHGPDQGPYWSNRVECLSGTVRLFLHSDAVERRDAPVARLAVDELRETLLAFARALAAAKPYTSAYNTTADERLADKVTAMCKASIGEALLKALGGEP
jgi:hypothetical protein